MSLVDCLVEGCPDALVICNCDGTIVVWNQMAERMFGWTSEEAIGQNCEQLLVPPESKSVFGSSFQRVVEQQAMTETRAVSIWNRERDVISVRFWMRSARQETQSQAIIFFRDQSQADQLESLLAHRELESRILNSASLYSNEEESFENALQKALDSLCQLTGWPLGHAMLPADNDQHLVSSTVWSSVKTEFQEFCEARSGGRFTRSDHTAAGVWNTGKPAWRSLTDPKNQIGVDRLPDGISSQFCIPIRIRSRVVAVLEFFLSESTPPTSQLQSLVRKLSQTLGHIIERRDWEDERRRMAAIVETSGDAILSKDPRGIITSWNEGAEKLYGYSAGEIVGQSLQMILPNGQTEEEPELSELPESGKRLEQFETRRRTKSGREIDVSITASPLNNSGGQLIGTASIERDITQKREAQLHLQQAIVAAEQASLAKSEFLANISHELRTPMNAILGMTELALQEQIPDTVHDYLTTAKDSADTMLFLINDILDFSRLEADRFELDPTPFDLRRMLEETLRTLSLRAHEKGLELIASVDPGVPYRIDADPLRIRQILTNLIGNAIKFTEKGEVVVRIELQPGRFQKRPEWNVGQQAPLRFCVQDTGIGISQEDQQRVFAPFTQADASTTRSYSGTGLGLSICRELVQLMGGDIWVESHPEQQSGSCFCFTGEFPVAAPSDEEPELTAADLDELKELPVLIVDDNDTTRQVLDEMLRSWSMDPVAVSNAQSALNQIQQATSEGTAFPLLIVDAVMPNQDGIELLNIIEESTESSGATILMMSPADKQLFRSRAQDVDVDAVLEKPVSQSGLLNAISEALGEVPLIKRPDNQFVVTDHPLHVLIAEDITANQKVMEAILRKRGHSYSIAHNGREAIDLFQRETFDAILMDVQMPIMDGLQAVRAIRSGEDSGRHIPIIAMTAHAMKGDREACLQAGMNAYVSKPIDAALVLTTLEQLAAPKPATSESIETIARRSGTWKMARRSRTNANRTASEEARSDQLAWNPDIAMARMDQDQSLLLSMIQFYLDDLPQMLTGLSSALESGDADEATRYAHSLKGLCSNFEATKMVSAAFQIEQVCRAAKLSEAKNMLPDFVRLLEELAEQLKVWQSTHQ